MSVEKIFNSPNLFNQVKLIENVLNGKKIPSNEENYSLVGFIHNTQYNRFRSITTYEDVLNSLAGNISRKKFENDDLFNICMMIYTAVLNISYNTIKQMKFEESSEISVERDGAMNLTIKSPYTEVRIKNYFKMFLKFQQGILDCNSIAKSCLERIGSLHMYIFYAHDMIMKNPKQKTDLMIDFLYKAEILRRELGLSSPAVLIEPLVDVGSIIVKGNYILLSKKDGTVYMVSNKNDLYSLGITTDNTSVIDRIIKGRMRFDKVDTPTLNQLPLNEFIG